MASCPSVFYQYYIPTCFGGAHEPGGLSMYRQWNGTFWLACTAFNRYLTASSLESWATTPKFQGCWRQRPSAWACWRSDMDYYWLPLKQGLALQVFVWLLPLTATTRSRKLLLWCVYSHRQPHILDNPLCALPRHSKLARIETAARMSSELALRTKVCRTMRVIPCPRYSASRDLPKQTSWQREFDLGCPCASRNCGT